MEKTSTILGAVLRWALTSLLAFLLAHKIITEEQAAQVNVSAIIGWTLPLLVPLAWSIYQKLRAHFKLNAALALPRGSTHDEVQAVVRESSTSDIISTQPKPSAIKAATQ